jgi:gluconolactonase
MRPSSEVVQPEKVAEVDAHEGPVYAPDENALYFTTLPVPGDDGPRVDINRLDLNSHTVSVVRADSGAANGMALGRDGRLVVCEQLGGALSLVDGFNSPNDVVVKSDGTIWFTDPSYGWLQGFRPRPLLRDAVRRYDPRSGAVTMVARSLDKPNGLCFSPDESVLYVTDSGAGHHIKAFDVLADDSLAGERVLAEFEPMHPDGIKADADGRLYASFPGGVRILEPDGEVAGEIELAGAVNFCFGGPERDVLFITADTAIYAAQLQAKGP